jgi:tRNA-dependent cyclodipeptide synthase
MISVGKEYHEGQKLVAIVDWINRNPHIDRVHISVNDYLQRHNLEAAGMSKEEAGQAALVAGSEWLERNKNILSKINVEKIYTRWENWFLREGFSAVHSELLSYAKTDPAFGEAMAKDARSLAERKTERGEAVPDSLVEHSHHYITEEMAVFAIQSRIIPAAEVYPGSNLLGAEYMRHLSPEAKAQLPEAIRPLADRCFARVNFDPRKGTQTTSQNFTVLEAA